MITSVLVALIESLGGVARIPKTVLESLDFDGKHVGLTVVENDIVVFIEEDQEEDE